MESRHETTVTMAELDAVGRRIEQSAPHVVGLSVTLLDQGRAFTLAASDQQVALLDVLQYLAGGPCVRAARQQAEVSMDRAGMHQEGWHLLASGMAGTGVASTLSIPLTVPVAGGAAVTGGVNLYGGSRGAFDGRQEELTRTCLEWAGDAVVAVGLDDLRARTSSIGDELPDPRRHAVAMDQALACLADVLAVSVDEARARLHSAAARGGVQPGRVAELVVGLLQRP